MRNAKFVKNQTHCIHLEIKDKNEFPCLHIYHLRLCNPAVINSLWRQKYAN